MSIIDSFDSKVLFFLQENLRNDILTKILLFFTRLGDYGILWFIVIAILLLKNRREIAIKSLSSLAISFLLGGIIMKPSIERLRPFQTLGDLNALIQPDGFSFPSGHTSTSFAMAFILYKNLPKKYGILFLIIAFIIAFSRIYLGAHFPTDIMGGIVLGAISAILTEKIYKIYINKVK
ncbi:MAG: phosphatase PAP2 family protein [Andreesenia angusta]|nr:phosphatase PAP2 family protein [Andreesenia angusta]